jgi:hypothetical protein
VGGVDEAAEQQDCNSCLMIVVDKYWQMMQLEYVEGGKLRLEMMINLPLIEGEGSSIASPYRMLSQGIRALQCPPDTKEIITISFKTYFLVLINRTAWNMELKQVTKLHHAVHDVMAVRLAGPSNTPSFGKLMAFMTHSGESANSGHYVTYVRKSEEYPDFFFYDGDRRATTAKEAVAMSSMAYVLLYKRCAEQHYIEELQDERAYRLRLHRQCVEHVVLQCFFGGNKVTYHNLLRGLNKYIMGGKSGPCGHLYFQNGHLDPTGCEFLNHCLSNFGPKPDMEWENYHVHMEKVGLQLLVQQVVVNLLTPLLCGDPMTYINGEQYVKEEVKSLIFQKLQLSAEMRTLQVDPEHLTETLLRIAKEVDAGEHQSGDLSRLYCNDMGEPCSKCGVTTVDPCVNCGWIEDTTRELEKLSSCKTRSTRSRRGKK